MQQVKAVEAIEVSKGRGQCLLTAENAAG